MIRMTFSNCRFGVVPIADNDGEEGFVVRLVEEKSEIVADTPMFKEAKLEFAKQVLACLNEDERRTLVPLITGGIVLP
jgi:hypothetical protein